MLIMLVVESKAIFFINIAFSNFKDLLFTLFPNPLVMPVWSIRADSAPCASAGNMKRVLS